MRQLMLWLSWRTALTLSLQHDAEQIKMSKEQVLIDAYATAVAKAFAKENDGLCTPFGSLDIILEDGSKWTSEKGADPLLKLCAKQQHRDPHELIKNFIKSKEQYKLQVISRPVNDVARALMCLGKGVGKGFDIKSKSSKISEEVNGYVPICQQCLDSKFINDEVKQTVKEKTKQAIQYLKKYDLRKKNKFALTKESLLETNVMEESKCRFLSCVNK